MKKVSSNDDRFERKKVRAYKEGEVMYFLQDGTVVFTVNPETKEEDGRHFNLVQLQYHGWNFTWGWE